MFIGLLSISSAIILSIVSAYFSVSGIVTIFSAAAISAMIMGASLEFSKIAATIWLYYWWKRATSLIKSYLVFAVVMLILVSSLGIFAFLTKAYVGQQQPASQIQNQMERIDSNIGRQQRDIERAEQALEALDESIAIYFEYDQVTRGLEEREKQQEERDALNAAITEAQNEIDNLRDKRVELQNEVEQIEINVGPIQYIAALLYGEDNAESNYDNAARLFIILLVLVFDPFAVLMMVSGNMAIDEANKEKKQNQLRQKRNQRKTKQRKEKKTKSQSSKELPLEDKKEEPEKKNRKVVEVDMTNYVDPNEVKQAKEATDHLPLRKRKPKSEESG